MKPKRTKSRDPRPFRAASMPGAVLALDPGGAGVIAAALRGKAPSPHTFEAKYPRARAIRFVPEAYETPWGTKVPSSIEDGVAVLRVCGPLEHHAAWWWDSYEDIIREVGAALEHDEVRAVVLRIDSPGGVAAGMGETHKALRRMQKATGKPVYAFADEMACSAAYHLASACAEVWTTEAGHVGSVGVILCTVDETERLEKDGYKVRYLVTGARKADLHPGQPVTDDVIAAAQAKVDKLGLQFFRAVAKARGSAPGGAALADPKAVRALQAAVFVGDDAVKAGLADGIDSWDRFLGYVKASVRAMGMTDQSVSAKARTETKGKPGAKAARRGNATMPKQKRKTLGQVAADEKTAKKARGMIASALALLGIGGDTAAKYSKKTEVTKHTVTEEDDSDPAEAEDDEKSETDMEEEEEESDAGSEAEEEEEGTESSAAEEEEEDSASDAEEEEEEEEEAAIPASAHKKALAAADKAYLSALPQSLRASAGIRAPSRLYRAAKRATGRTSIDGIMGALSAMPVATKAHAKIEADVAKIKADTERAKIGAIVQKAKAEGRVGATTHDGRESLRAIGAKNGAAFLRAHIATLPRLPAKAKAPKIAEGNGPNGAPSRDEQTQIVDSLFAGMSTEQREKAEADFKSRMNGATKATPRS